MRKKGLYIYASESTMKNAINGTTEHINEGKKKTESKNNQMSNSENW